MFSQLDKPLNMCYTTIMEETKALPEAGVEVLAEDELPREDPDGIDLRDESGEAALLSRIPQMQGGPKTADAKATYLGYRATGFPIRQACYLTDINQSTLGRWREADPAFKDFELNRLKELQDSVGDDLIKLAFMRNMRMALDTDFKIIYRAVHDMDTLTEREFKYLQSIRRLYGAQDLVAINRALSPEGGSDFDFSDMVLKVSQTRMEVHVTKERNTPDQELIEGESRPA